MNDYDATVWVPEGSPSLAADLAVDNNDYFKITTTSGSGSKYWEKDPTTNPTVGPSGTYKVWKLRYKTAGTIKAKVVVDLSVSGATELLPESSSSTWKLVEGTFTVNELLQKIRIYIVGTHAADTSVYYDFTLVCQGEFEFPSSIMVQVNLPSPREVNIPIPGKDGVAPQDLGSEPATVHITGDMELGSWGTPSGQYFYQIWHKHTWQWFKSEDHGVQFKIKPAQPSNITARDGKLVCDLLLREYRLGDASKESYAERFGI